MNVEIEKKKQEESFDKRMDKKADAILNLMEKRLYEYKSALTNHAILLDHFFPDKELIDKVSRIRREINDAQLLVDFHISNRKFRRERKGSKVDIETE